MRTPPFPRLWGIDLARFVAIVGMMAAHLVVIRGDTEWLRGATSGFPSTLFSVLGGFGLVFAARRYRFPQQVPGAIAAGVTRGAIIVLIGFMIEFLPPHPIYVILVYYGSALILLAPLISAPTWVLGSVGTMLAVAGPFIIAAQEHPGRLDYSGVLPLLQSVLIGGTYPAVTWVVYMLVGMILCRWLLSMNKRGLARQAALLMILFGTLTGLAAWGAGLLYRTTVQAPSLMSSAGLSRSAAMQQLSASGFGTPSAAGWAAVLDLSPHTGSMVDLARTGGISVAIIGLSLLLASGFAKPPPVLRPAIGVGAAPLTMYTLHLVMTSFTVADAGGFSAYADLSQHPLLQHAFFIQLAVLLILGTYFGFAGRRGPLEILVSRAAQATARSVDVALEPRPD